MDIQNLIVCPRMLVILKLILGPHMQESCVLPFQSSHAQHRTCLQPIKYEIWFFFSDFLKSHPGVGFPLKILIEPLLPQSHQLHHLKYWQVLHVCYHLSASYHSRSAFEHLRESYLDLVLFKEQEIYDMYYLHI